MWVTSSVISEIEAILALNPSIEEEPVAAGGRIRAEVKLKFTEVINSLSKDDHNYYHYDIFTLYK